MSFIAYNLWVQPGCIWVKASTGFFALGETTGAQCPFQWKHTPRLCLKQVTPSDQVEVWFNLSFPVYQSEVSLRLSSGSRDLLQQSGVPEEPIRGSVMDSQRCLYTWLSLYCLEDCSRTSSDTCERLVGLQSQRKKFWICIDHTTE